MSKLKIYSAKDFYAKCLWVQIKPYKRKLFQKCKSKI